MRVAMAAAGSTPMALLVADSAVSLAVGHTKCRNKRSSRSLGKTKLGKTKIVRRNVLAAPVLSRKVQVRTGENSLVAPNALGAESGESPGKSWPRDFPKASAVATPSTLSAAWLHARTTPSPSQTKCATRPGHADPGAVSRRGSSLSPRSGFTRGQE